MEKNAALTERLLAFLVLAGVAGTWSAESRSGLADRVRTLQPVVTWMAVKAPGSGAPLLFATVHQPEKRSLSIIHVPGAARGAITPLPRGEGSSEGAERRRRSSSPSGNSEPAQAALAAAAEAHRAVFSLPRLSHLDLGPPRFLYAQPRDFPPGDPPVAMKRWLAASYGGLSFWKRLPGLLRRPPLGDCAPAENFFDRLAYALELHRLPRRSMLAAWLPEGRGREAFLLERLGPPRRGARPPDRPVSVEVLNATEFKGVAMRVGKVLRLRGADVLSFRNTDSDHPGTLVYDRTGRIENALQVLDMLGCPQAEAVTAVEERPLVEVSVVIKADCSHSPPLRGGE
ncbi:MAG: LytR C-terminal domain-containing protein [Elusimicrobia bacterium]|nr:LytR C-terminal domain-containing protein [Elusimicrobiota bacterium]